jgi:hypothetical protein
MQGVQRLWGWIGVAYRCPVQKVQLLILTEKQPGSKFMCLGPGTYHPSKCCNFYKQHGSCCMAFERL